MKRLICIYTLLSLSIISFAQNYSGYWNASTNTYSNDDFNVKWTLPSELTWQRFEAKGKNIKFKAIETETAITVMMNLRNDQNYGGDIWDSYSYLSSKEYKDMIIQNSRKAGVIVNAMDAVKSQIDGIHAIKTASFIKRNEPELGGYTEFYQLTYMFAYDGNLYNVTVEVMEEIRKEIEDYDFIVNLIMKGIKVTR
jgi:hypothetical protein